MTVTTYIRGKKAYFDDERQIWFFEDGNEVGKVAEICSRCHTHHLPNECDWCLRPLKECGMIVSACCGHGIEPGYIQLKDGRIFREEIFYD